jgi:hypothetical protein
MSLYTVVFTIVIKTGKFAHKVAFLYLVYISLISTNRDFGFGVFSGIIESGFNELIVGTSEMLEIGRVNMILVLEFKIKVTLLPIIMS